MGLKLRSLHVHHGLRGEEADRDGDFSIKISEALGVPCHMIKAEVKKYASQTGCRKKKPEGSCVIKHWRKAWAWEGENGQTVKIAVAHHSRDQAETILLNLFRGSGLGGLKGIPYVRDRIIRPMLDGSKEDIIPYLEKKRLKWVNDSSNDTDHYARNRVRSHIPSGDQRRNQSGSRGRNTPCRVSSRNGRCVSEKTGRTVGAKICKRGRAYLDDPEGSFKEADP